MNYDLNWIHVFARYVEVFKLHYKVKYVMYFLVLGRSLQTSVLLLAGSLPINDR